MFLWWLLNHVLLHCLLMSSERIVIKHLSPAQVCFLEFTPKDPESPPAALSCCTMAVFRAHHHFPGMAWWISTLVLDGLWTHSPSLEYSRASFRFQLSHFIFSEASRSCCALISFPTFTHMCTCTHTRIRVHTLAHTHLSYSHPWVLHRSFDQGRIIFLSFIPPGMS